MRVYAAHHWQASSGLDVVKFSIICKLDVKSTRLNLKWLKQEKDSFAGLDLIQTQVPWKDFALFRSSACCRYWFVHRAQTTVFCVFKITILEIIHCLSLAHLLFCVDCIIDYVCVGWLLLEEIGTASRSKEDSAGLILLTNCFLNERPSIWIQWVKHLFDWLLTSVFKVPDPIVGKYGARVAGIVVPLRPLIKQTKKKRREWGGSCRICGDDMTYDIRTTQYILYLHSVCWLVHFRLLVSRKRHIKRQNSSSLCVTSKRNTHTQRKKAKASFL